MDSEGESDVDWGLDDCSEVEIEASISVTIAVRQERCSGAASSILGCCPSMWGGGVERKDEEIAELWSSTGSSTTGSPADTIMHDDDAFETDVEVEQDPLLHLNTNIIAGGAGGGLPHLPTESCKRGHAKQSQAEWRSELRAQA